MAKVSLSKVTSKKVIAPKLVKLENADVYIKQYLPIDDKAAFIERVLNNAIDDTGSFSPVRLKVYFALEIIRTYTNITITESQFSAAGKTYDLIVENELLQHVLDIIPKEEYAELKNNLYECAQAVESYNHSAAGIIKSIVTDYNGSKMDIDSLLQQLSDPEQVGLVKDILTKL